MAECPARRHGTRNKQCAGTRRTWDPWILAENHMLLRMLQSTIDHTWQKRVRLFYSGTSGYSDLKRSIRIGEMTTLENLEKCYETRNIKLCGLPYHKKVAC